MSEMEPNNLPRKMTNGSLSMNFLSNIRDLDGDGVKDNSITTLSNNTDFEPVGADGTKTTQEEFYGANWRKVAFYMEMNSSPGVRDGVLKQWVDDQLIFSNENVPWMGPSSPGNRKWNIVHFGGNSHFHAYPDEDRREEWYAIDDIYIATDIPGAEQSQVFEPEAPADLVVD
ncbi:hypothetical protein CF392_02545 [Tamilnaduibacter salinus]|uniref:Uncharacterized protein n=2 Tax=Tamilnaduibacter salinus TaxID=1484056 RepID=A0A2A2I7E9_9GAMM|nr:hypothetical protein CF392_02545 [Tamilnaduibacter salinus]